MSGDKLQPQRAKSGVGFVMGLRCLRCGREYGVDEIEYVCDCRPNQGSDMGTLDVIYDYAAIRQVIDPARLALDPDSSIGRYWPLLPIARRTSLPPLPVGGTPLLEAPRLAAELGMRRLFIKDDGRNPSASLKDRASAIAVAKAQEQGRSVVATASTGNAAAALAGQSAAAGQANVIFVPRTAPPAKIAQLLVYGSTVLAVDGSYDQAFDLCTQACLAFGWYNRNTGYNPYMTEGKRTVAFEIGEQLARWLAHQGGPGQARMAVPDALFVPVGDGCIIGGVHKGFSDLMRLGWTERMPRLYGVQSDQSAALANAWRAGLEVPEPVQATTRADSISVDAPRDAVKALRAVRESGGAYIAVSDEAILAALLPLARQGAVFAEPAGAAAYAGLVAAAAQELIGADETVVVINTGSGLKDVAAAMSMTGEPLMVRPELGAVREALAGRGL
ncbi:MAG: threonine synthase [Caldilineaceae bacterium]|nr:threonine synthase [Caldilineaceae bacterium]